MKILIVNRALGTLFGGGESFDLNAARYLVQRGHEVTMVSGKPLWGDAKNHFAGMQVVYVPCPELRRYAYATECIYSKLSAAFYHLDNALFERAVFRWLAMQKPWCFDVVQCCSLFGLPKRLLKTFQIPTVSWLPGPPSGRVRKRIHCLLTNPHFGLFTHGSPVWALQDMGLTIEQDFEVIEPGVELARIDGFQRDSPNTRAQIKITDDDLLGITTARLVPVKNHHFLFQGIAQAKANGVIWQWAIIGNGPLESELRRQASVLGIGAQIHFLGYQASADVHRWLGTADLFALTSSYENFSIATLEAMSHGLPLVATEVGYLQHLVRDSCAGLVVPVGQADALANAMVRMADPSVREQYGQHGREFVSRLDWPLIAERLERLYIKTIEGWIR